MGGNKEWEGVSKDAEGRSRGILTMWRSKKLKVRSFWDTTGLVIVNGVWNDKNIDVVLINIYSPCDSKSKVLLWDLLENIISQYGNACICIGGDFNEIKRSDERVGKSPESNKSIQDKFNNFILKSDLIDLPLQGRRFTFYKANGTCRSRLDRFLLNSNWLQVWPNCYQRGLKRGLSDHCPISLEVNGVDWGPKPFKSSNGWLEHPDFRKFVGDKWQNYEVEGWGGYVIREKIKKLRTDLKRWNREVFGISRRKIEERREEIWKLDMVEDTLGLDEEEVITRNREKALLLCDLKATARLRRQKAKKNWVINGDANTTAFHRVINGRRKSNEIAGPYINNKWSNEVDRVKREIFTVFKNHFEKKGSSNTFIREDWVANKVSEEDNTILTRGFTGEEVLDILENCDDNKSPGPDGINLAIFRECWSSIKADFMRLLSEFHESGILTTGLNNSFITLIKKSKDSVDLKDFRPISLIGGPYKILSKLLATRLKKIMGKIISDEQSAFIGGRFITDSIISLQNIFEWAKETKASMFGYKIDFEKAYDSIDWSFLEKNA